MPRVIIDNRKIEAQDGATVLQVCLDNGIYVPNLCYLEGQDTPRASCRLCLVEIAGTETPVASCTIKVKEGMVVNTDTEAVRRLQKTALQLLLSVHKVDCARCPANKKCALQDIARFLKVGLKPKHLEPHLKDTEVIQEHPLLDYYPNQCVLCGKCISVCGKNNGQTCITFAKRGFDTVISFYGEEDAATDQCKACGECVAVCPVGAIRYRVGWSQDK